MPSKFIDRELLRELWCKGEDTSKIAEILGAKENTVYKYAHRLGLPKRKHGYKPMLDIDPEKKSWLIKNYPEMSNSTISVYIGLSPKYIGILARKLGLKKSEEYWKGIREYHRKRIKQFHATKKGDKEYYAYNIRPKDENGKFIKKEKP